MDENAKRVDIQVHALLIVPLLEGVCNVAHQRGNLLE
jgi:hypothetical protein